MAQSYGRLIFRFLRNIHTVFYNGALIHTTTKSGLMYLHLRMFTSLCYVWFLNDSHFNLGTQTFIVVLIFVFLMTTSSILSYAFWLFVVNPLKKACSYPQPISEMGCLFHYWFFFNFSYILDVIYQMYSLQYFLLCCQLSLHFVKYFLCCAEASKLDVILFVYFCFYCLASEILSRKS